MKNKKGQKETVIIGVVRDFEEDDDTPGIEISTDDEDYIVEMNKQGKKLLNEIYNTVEATGMITTDEDGAKRITVSSFEVLETEDEYEDEDDFDYKDDDFDYKYDED